MYVGSDDTNVYAVDERTGNMLWHTKLGDKVKSSPAIVQGVLIVGCEDKKLYELDIRNGKVLWTFDAADRISSAPVVDDEVVYVGSWDGFLYAIDIKNRERLNGSSKQMDALPHRLRLVLTSFLSLLTPAPSFALNAADGAVIWQSKNGRKNFRIASGL